MSNILRLQKSPRMSQVVVAGDFAFLSGQVADNLQGTIQEQTAEVLHKVESLLLEAGSDKSRLLSINIWLSDIKHFDAMNDIYETWLDNSHQPTRACVQSTLADPNYLIEIKATALIRDQE